MKTVFLRVLDVNDKATALLEAVHEPERARGRQRFEVDTASFTAVPRSPFAYWVSERFQRLFKEMPAFETEGRTAKQGLATADDFRFVRAWWAVPADGTGIRWFSFAKGGKFSPFYAALNLSVNWAREGAEISNFHKGDSSRVASRPQNTNFFFRSGLTWPRRTSSGLSMRAMPTGSIFADKGPAAFVDDDDGAELLAVLAIASSRGFGMLVSLQLAAADAAARSYEVGLIQTTPVPRLTDSDREALARLARRGWWLTRSLDIRSETSHAFTIPALLQVPGADLAARTDTWSDHVRTVEAELAAIQTEITNRSRI